MKRELKINLMDEELLELIAEEIHTQWAGWMAYMLTNLSVDNLNRWDRQRKTRYDKLTEKERDSDRALAKRILEKISDWWWKQP